MTEVDYTPAGEEAIDELSDPVVMEKSDVESLKDKAGRAEELDSQLEQMNSNLDELAERTDLLDEVDEDKLDELRETDEAVVLPEDEYEELSGLVDEVGGIFAEELAEYSPFDGDELQDRFTPMELKERVDEHEEASVESELGASEEDPEPEGGAVDEEELSGDNSDVTEEELREEIASTLETDGLDRQATKVRDGEIGLDEFGIDTDAVLN